MWDPRECWLLLTTGCVACAYFTQAGLITTEASDISDDCRIFNDLKYSYEEDPYNRSVELVLILDKTLPEVLVRMRSADCILECSDMPISSVCNFTYQDPTEPALTSRISDDKVKQLYVFHNISGRNFCASVWSPYCPKDFGPLTTSTHQFDDVIPRNISVVPTPKKLESSASMEAIAVAVSVLAAVLVAVVVYFARRWRSQRAAASAAAASGASDTSTLLLDPLPPATAILLLYSRDSDRFQRLMAAFRSLLAALTGLEVLDMLDERRLDEVADYPGGWVAHHLRRPDVRVVLVVSEGALARHRALRGRQAPPAHSHFAEPYFTHALRIMQEDADIGDKYNRVFTVRFEEVTQTRETFDLITSMRTFCLMRHIGSLIHQITGGTTRPDLDDEAWSQSILSGLPEADYWYKVLNEHWP